MSEPRRRISARQLLPALRVLIAAAMIWYLAVSGVIEWHRLGGLLHAWPLTLAALAVLFAGFVMASWRFCILTQPCGLNVTLGNSLRLTLIGNAANFLLPTIGSDLIRVWYASGGHTGRRTEIATIVLLDRVIGLAGILLLPLLLAPFFPAVVRGSPVIISVLVVSAAAAAALVGAVLVALSRRGIASAPVQWVLRVFPLRGYPARVLETIHGYRSDTGALVRALTWAVAANLCAVGCVILLQLATNPGTVHAVLGGFLAASAFVLNNVPITPGGIGFTEAAVDSLFRIAGMTGGAEMMLGMRVLFVALAPAGVVLYLRGVRGYLTPVPAAAGPAPQP
ncbi:MAG: lysylphosphatidylglycerol synthase transmembrane domain-containing protein [Gemmatimonadaceae bacterium]